MTAHQQTSKANFQRAVLYAKAQMKIPAAKADYARSIDDKLSNAYTVALVDCLKGPEILQVDTSRYAGHAGDGIVIHARDNFRVEAVCVEVRSAEGIVLESGAAVWDAREYTKWIFRSAKAIALKAGTRVIVKAEDKPRNITVKEVVLDTDNGLSGPPPDGNVLVSPSTANNPTPTQTRTAFAGVEPREEAKRHRQNGTHTLVSAPTADRATQTWWNVNFSAGNGGLPSTWTYTVTSSMDRSGADLVDPPEVADVRVVVNEDQSRVFRFQVVAGFVEQVQCVDRNFQGIRHNEHRQASTSAITSLSLPVIRIRANPMPDST